MTGSPSSWAQGNQCLQSKMWVPSPEPQHMGSALGRACPGLALRLRPLPWDVLYQEGPIKGTKVLTGYRHPSLALAAGPGSGCSRNPHSLKAERERAGSLGCLPGAEPHGYVRLGCCLAGAPRLAEHRQEAGGRGLQIWTLESSSLESES